MNEMDGLVRGKPLFCWFLRKSLPGELLGSRYNKWFLKSLDYLKSCLENVNSSHYRKLKINLWWIVLFLKWRKTLELWVWCLLDARQGSGKPALTNCEHGQDIWPLWASVSLSEIHGFELIILKVLSSEVQRALAFDLRPSSPGSLPSALHVASAPLNSRGHPLHREPSPPHRPLAVQVETGHRPATQKSGLSCLEPALPRNNRDDHSLRGNHPSCIFSNISETEIFKCILSTDTIEDNGNHDAYSYNRASLVAQR